MHASEFPSISLDNQGGFPAGYFEDFAPAFTKFIETVNSLHERGFRKLSLQLKSDYGANWGIHCPTAVFKYRNQEVIRLHIHKDKLFVNEGFSLHDGLRASVANLTYFVGEALYQKGLASKAQRKTLVLVS